MKILNILFALAVGMVLAVLVILSYILLFKLHLWMHHELDPDYQIEQSHRS